jgi:hypothetical protein
MSAGAISADVVQHGVAVVALAKEQDAQNGGKAKTGGLLLIDEGGGRCC